ncbi:hypothetical protein V8G54_001816 [Vigna mungo]|uniref:Uncharacterized protein n=1 Tax=Vigna mungo TaxID=3915 RepID=A0AAQ3PA43_VIGMU
MCITCPLVLIKSCMSFVLSVRIHLSCFSCNIRSYVSITSLQTPESSVCIAFSNFTSPSCCIAVINSSMSLRSPVLSNFSSFCCAISFCNPMRLSRPPPLIDSNFCNISLPIISTSSDSTLCSSISKKYCNIKTGKHLTGIESYPEARCRVLPCGQAIPARDIGYFSECKPPRLNPIQVSNETFFVRRESMCIGTSLMANMGWVNVVKNRHYNLASVVLTLGDFDEFIQAPA